MGNVFYSPERPPWWVSRVFDNIKKSASSREISIISLFCIYINLINATFLDSHIIYKKDFFVFSRISSLASFIYSVFIKVLVYYYDYTILL